MIGLKLEYDKSKSTTKFYTKHEWGDFTNSNQNFSESKSRDLGER